MREAAVFYSGAAEINELLRGFGLSRLLSEATTGDAGRAERAPV
jgi:hypothetical protein